MRIIVHDNSVHMWLSANDTYRWATRPGERWPCSQLSGKRLYASFDSGGLVDVAVNGCNNANTDGGEFNAITSDHLAQKLPKSHPAYFVTVGQFKD